MKYKVTQITIEKEKNGSKQVFLGFEGVVWLGWLKSLIKASSSYHECCKRSLSCILIYSLTKSKD